jgi:DNA polymerase
MGVDQHIDWRAAAASALDWWRDAGVDTLIDEAPRDWFKPAAVPMPVPVPGAAAPVAPQPAAMPANLREFEAWRIGAAAPDAGWNRPIAPQGDAHAGLMILIDMPEREDAATGQLLSGEPGRLFDRMLAAIGRDRQSIYLASLAAARPVSGQIPTEALDRLTETALHHIALVRPKRLLLLGNAASRAVLGANAAAARQSLHVLNHAGGQSGAVASFHPRFLLQQPARKAEAWRDLQMVIGGIDA